MMIRPVNKRYGISLGFGVKYPKKSKQGNLQWVTSDGLHHGIDYLTSVGTKIFAPCKGIVTKISSTPTAGLQIALKFFIGKDIYRFCFMHLSSIPGKYAIGDVIGDGVMIALSGDSGMAKGHPHLHFQLDKYNPKTMSWDYIDPATVGDMFT